MPARTLANMGLKSFFDLGEDGWNDENDLNMLQLSVLAQATAISKVSTTPGVPTADDIHIFDETHPTNANAVAIYDNDTGGPTWKYFTPQTGWLVWNQAASYFEIFDGTVWSQYKPTAYDLKVSFEATPTAGQIVGRVRVPRQVILPANLTGSFGGIGTNPTAAFPVDIQDDGVSIGTISVSTGGAFTFTTAGGTAKTLAAGSEITFVAPTPPDSTAALFSAAIVGTSS